jgi:hypothetical protein
VSAIPQAALSADQLDEIVIRVWRRLMDETLTSATANTGVSGCTIVASISVSEGWRGTIFLCCARRTADRLAAALHDRAPEQIDAVDRGDAVGELLNVVAGNLRYALPSGSRFDLPLTVERQPADAPRAEPPGDLMIDRSYRYGDDTLSVQVRTG